MNLLNRFIVANLKILQHFLMWSKENTFCKILVCSSFRNLWINEPDSAGFLCECRSPKPAEICWIPHGIFLGIQQWNVVLPGSRSRALQNSILPGGSILKMDFVSRKYIVFKIGALLLKQLAVFTFIKVVHNLDSNTLWTKLSVCFNWGCSCSKMCPASPKSFYHNPLFLAPILCLVPSVEDSKHAFTAKSLNTSINSSTSV